MGKNRIIIKYIFFVKSPTLLYALIKKLYLQVDFVTLQFRIHSIKSDLARWHIQQNDGNQNTGHHFCQMQAEVRY